MLTRTTTDAIHPSRHASDEALALSRLEARLPPLLSVIAGMVDLTGFFTLGNIFTAHVTGNLVVIAAEAVRGGPLNLAQTLSVPVFILAVAAVWLLDRASGRRGPALTRLLLLVQFLLLTGILILSVITKPSANPHGLMAGIAVMMAVSAMACQFALFRLALPGGISTAVMTGNLTNTVLSLMDILSHRGLLMTADAGRLKRSLHLLFGFLVGCIVAAAAISLLADWAWSLPVALAAVAVALP
ncbi:YoaK family protein [Bradyrhizobium erythrophlei]|jgi:uncharacterized membrane protein YoaK (UPF0700 family)|uniref:Uncharacterized membrane protein YoaK, UPF0700 family n=1 Tax=Bradyrhizobium erythrophlei TaxID=1437360 RepID=A0A1M5IRA0_9BRAD|nr:DUF1275 family protein [Bradyrhizobium erythrophlei]SHG30745.1 Uncharacterized membrane protein YoaK, UPF0700 family [Bradyrhizobium erythrophlei]